MAVWTYLRRIYSVWIYIRLEECVKFSYPDWITDSKYLKEKSLERMFQRYHIWTSVNLTLHGWEETILCTLSYRTYIKLLVLQAPEASVWISTTMTTIHNSSAWFEFVVVKNSFAEIRQNELCGFFCTWNM